MDVASSGPYMKNRECGSRLDAQRFLHLPRTEHDDLCHELWPSTPCASRGGFLAKDYALRVTSHLQCPRHEYQYHHWSWALENGTVVQYHGFLEARPSLTTQESCSSDGKTLFQFKR